MNDNNRLVYQAKEFITTIIKFYFTCNQGHNQSDQKIEKNRPIFVNLAKTVAQISKIKLKIQNIYI